MKISTRVFRYVTKSLMAITASAILLSGSRAWAAGFNAILQGQDNGSTNWFGGPLNNWAELNDVPCRVRLTGGPATGKVITVDFDHFKASAPAIQNLINFTNTANVVITAGPTLSAPTGSAIWHYIFTIDLTASRPARTLLLADR